MESVLSKWGNSLGIRIPMSIVKDLDLEEGSKIIIREEDNRIVIYPKRPSLDEFLQAITPDNLHRETDTGTYVGNEQW